ncbi:MAG: DUF4886 domain-containing protein [Lachnospiraceae bacterium]|nr:DUF4886 domain-containing protein [Lachnospiraceae bacterium]
MKKFICIIFAWLLCIMASIDTYAAASNHSAYVQENQALSPDSGQVTPDLGEKTPLRVLIVGNSFSRYKTGNVTYSIEQPLEELAKASGHNLEVTTLAHGSSRMVYYAGMNEAHITYYRELMQLLSSETWDYIILQEHSTSPIERFDSATYPALERLLQYIRDLQPQAKPLLYMTHSFSNGTSIKVNGVSKQLTIAQMELYLAAAYKTLENRLNVDVVPAGMHMNRANYLYPKIKTLGNDSKHPAYAGYYLMACCFYNKIYGTVPEPEKAVLTNCTLTTQELKALALMTADSLTMNKQELRLNENKTATLTTTPKRSDLTFKSLDPSIASVNAKTGVVTAKQGGYTLIVAEAPDGLQALCGVTVNIPPSFICPYYMAGKGETIQILPRTNYPNLKWSSNKKSVASVDTATGVVTVNASGRAVITVTNTDNTSMKASYVLYVPFDTPQNMKASSNGNPAEAAAFGNIKVSWKASAGAPSYDIYRSTSKNGTYTKIGTSNTNSYIDKTAAVNKYYYYKVTARNSYEQCTSPLSKSVRGIILRASTVKAKLTKAKKVRLTWNKNTRASGYVIYRSTKKNSGYKQIARITSGSKISYIDKTVKNNKTYYYRIKAFKTLNNRNFYGVKSVKVKIKVTT